MARGTHLSVVLVSPPDLLPFHVLKKHPTLEVLSLRREVTPASPYRNGSSKIPAQETTQLRTWVQRCGGSPVMLSGDSGEPHSCSRMQRWQECPQRNCLGGCWGRFAHGGAPFASTSSFLSICKSDSAALLTINCMIGASFSLQLETTSAAGEDMEVENVTLDDRAFSSAPDMTLELESSSTADVPVRKLLV